MNLSGKRVVVIGLGASGAAAAKLCARRGGLVVGNDSKQREQLGEVAEELEQAGVALSFGQHDLGAIAAADVIVLSPGVPPFAALDEAERRGAIVIGELELAVSSLEHRAPIVCIGGTNGKSTTTSLIGEMLEKSGKAVFVGGNLGEPLSNRVDQKFDAIVLEVSSFQLERLRTFHPRVSVLLNVTPDHLDRYADFGAYADAKGNAFVRQTAADTAVVPFGDAICERQAKRGGAQIVSFGASGDFVVTDNSIEDRKNGVVYDRAAMAIQGGHNALNAAAALAAVAAMGVVGETNRASLKDFHGLPHRMRFVAEIDSVRYYDDSKGTNVGASVTALRGLREPKAVLIAGGRDKHTGYDDLVAALRERGRAAVVIGEAADAIEVAIGGAIPVVRAASMAEAVKRSAELAKSGDAVLLSPACSSYDMFRDYAHRGREFAAAVSALNGGDR